LLPRAPGHVAQQPITSRRQVDRLPSDAHWQSLHYFNIYRLAVAVLFFLSMLAESQSRPFGIQNLTLALWTSRAYLAAAVAFFIRPARWRSRFNWLLTAEVVVDVVALTLLMYAGGGSRSGFSYMILVVLAGAGLVGEGRQTLFYASVASVAVLLEQGYRMLTENADLADLTFTGIICIGFFGMAISAHLLSKRVVANEELARKRGEELAEQVDINEQVIRDMLDGVLVADGGGRVRQHNPRAEYLCGVRVPGLPRLEDFSAELARCYGRWRQFGGARTEVLRLPLPGGRWRMLRVRFVPAAAGDNCLLYLEDMEQIQSQAQQLKLAALGRLTANMAHEIRNPLAAISHAAELLEGSDAGSQIRLVRIIGDNTQRLNRLVTDVLELGRRDRAQSEDIAVTPFLSAFLDEMALIDGRARELVRVENDGVKAITFDRSHLSRVLANLVGNALRYCSGNEGCVSVRVSSLEGGKTSIAVGDDGPGIPAELRGQVFEPFFTTRSSGTGLGLYIARELCEANGATLELLEEGPGARFRIVAGRG